MKRKTVIAVITLGCMSVTGFSADTMFTHAASVGSGKNVTYSGESPQAVKKNGADSVRQDLDTSASVTSSTEAYRLRQGDELSIRVAQQPELGNNNGMNVPFAVRPDGNVSFPMVGSVKADGLTVEEFTDELNRALSRYIINPDISVNITKLGGVRVYVFGEINNPGAYTLTKSSTVIDAIGAAGSFNWDTAKKKIYLIHQDQPEKPITINLNRMLQTGDMSENYVMREGDILYLTKNSRINFARDIAPLITGAYMVSRIGKND